MADVWDGYASVASQPNTNDIWAGVASPASAPEEPGFFSRVGSDLENRNQMVQSAAGRYSSGQQTMPETLLQATGKGVLGAVNDVIGEGVKSVASTLTPDFIKQPIANLATQAMQSPLGQGALSLAKQAGQAYSGFEQNNPRAAANLESIGNIALAIPSSKAATATSSLAGTGLNKVGGALVNMGEMQAKNAKNDFIKDLITPKQTPTVAADRFRRSTEQGLLRSRVVEPNLQEKEIMDTVSQLPVSSSKSTLANYNIISNANKNEAQNLIGMLKTKDVNIADDTIINGLAEIRKNLAASPYITGNAATSADRVMNVALDKIANNPQTASGLLQARKEFDEAIQRFRGDKVFDPATDNPVTEAVKQIRQGINNMIDMSVPDVGVKASLRKQSNFYRAMDNIETKGASEGSNMLKRAAQKAADLIPVKGAIAKGALAVGMTGLAAAAPSVALGAGAAYGAGKALNSSILKRGVGRTLQGAGTLMGGRK